MKKIETQCGACSAIIFRKPFNHNTGKPIKNSFCNPRCRGDWIRDQKPYNKKWLTQKYVVEGMNCVQISQIVDRDPKRVWEWIRDYGIETRPRGSDLSRQWAESERIPKPWTHGHTEEFKENQRQRRLSDGRVPYMKDGKPYMKGRRGELHHGWQGGLTPERAALASTEEWADAVKAVWHRADAKCERCGADHRAVDNRKKDGFHIHHIIPFRFKEYRTALDNLILLCRPCHHYVHSKKNTTGELINVPQ